MRKWIIKIWKNAFLEMLYLGFFIFMMFFHDSRFFKPPSGCYRHCRTDWIRRQHSLWFLCWLRYCVTACRHRLSNITTGEICKGLQDNWGPHSMWSWRVWCIRINITIFKAITPVIVSTILYYIGKTKILKIQFVFLLTGYLEEILFVNSLISWHKKGTR